MRPGGKVLANRDVIEEEGRSEGICSVDLAGLDDAIAPADLDRCGAFLGRVAAPAGSSIPGGTGDENKQGVALISVLCDLSLRVICLR